MKAKLVHIIAVIILLSLVKVTFSQAPNLGTTAGFALFTATGAFNNVGDSTMVTGDVGTNVGAFSAFTPGTVAGQIYVADAVSAQAAIDAEVAYSYLNGLSCDSVLGTTLGNGQILTPKIYCLGDASTLNGTLTLDGQGNSNALFIIKINGSFSTSAFSNVILINSAFFYNVYWQINGAFAAGDSSVFRGAIIANGAISLLEGASLYGRGISIAGAISLHNDTVNMGIIPGNPLPVELLNFVALRSGASVQLIWSTASETNNDFFTVQRSKDGISFENIVQQKGAGNSNAVLYYSATDHDPYTTFSIYRLKQTDFDGKFTYSNLVSVDIVNSAGFSIYPNPFKASAGIIVNDALQIYPVTIARELKIYNGLGIEVMSTSITKQLTTVETSELPTGIYFYKLIANNETVQSGKLVSE